MNNINYLFVPYDESLQLKELGFDEPCFGYYDLDGLQVNTHHWYPENKNSSFPLPHTTNNPKISAPTFSQAFKFFRVKYNSHHSITRLPQGALDADSKNNKVLKKYVWFISKDDLNPTIPNDGSGKCDTYEEAELACLRKLIQIVKTKKL